MALWRTEDSERERFQVLHDCGEVELIAGARETAKAHALEAVVGLEVGEPHLDPLSLISRSGERLGLHLPPCDIASIFVKIAWDFARLVGGAALGSDRARITIML